MKKSMIFVGLLAIGYANAQEYDGKVGINTNEPKATLDITPEANNLTGTTNEGIIAPRLSKTRIANIEASKLTEGTLVYSTDAVYTAGADTAKNNRVAKINEKGYYFYNGTEWVKVQYKDTDTNDAEWVYDDTTKRISLKRSGQTTGFVNKVYYDAQNGNFYNGAITSSERYDTTSNTVITEDYTSNTKNTIANLSSNLIATMNSSRTINSKGNSVNYLAIDEKDTSLPNVSENRTADSNRIDIYSNHTSDLRNVTAVNGTVSSWATSGNKAALIGVTGSSVVRKGDITSTIYSTGLRGESYWNSTGDANQLLGVWLSSNMGADAGNAKEVASVRSITNAGGTGTINEMAGFLNMTGTYNHFKGTLTNLYGMKYTHNQHRDASKPDNHYGIYIGDVSSAKDDKNFAVYTNAGKVRLGDLADAAATGNRQVVVDANGVLKVGTAAATIADATLKATDTTEQCTADKAGTIHYKEVAISGATNGEKKGVFGFCTKQNGNAVWVYLSNGGNIMQGTGTFGQGL